MNIATAQSVLRQQPGVKVKAFVSLGHLPSPNGQPMVLMPQVAVVVDGISSFNTVVDQLKAQYKRNWCVTPVVTDVSLG
jgi:hypothetical protein